MNLMTMHRLHHLPVVESNSVVGIVSIGDLAKSIIDDQRFTIGQLESYICGDRMPHHGMTPHISGTSLSAQARYAAGVRKILECWFELRPIRPEYLIVEGGKLAGAGAHSYSAGDTTKGAEKAATFQRA